ncbi:hypothetical protein BJX70DRAFT_318806 [Aspergillus crustosus]
MSYYVRADMPDKDGGHCPFYPPEEKSHYQILKEGGYDNVLHFMNSHLLEMFNDDDVQEAKAILDCFAERDRIHANGNAQENNKAYSSVLGSEMSSPGVCLCGDEVARNDREAESGEGAYSYFEWGADEPEFEGYPVFSDDEGDDGSNQCWHNEASGQDYYENEDYGDQRDQRDHEDYEEDGDCDYHNGYGDYDGDGDDGDYDDGW